jgi:hypothetical protein
VRGRGGSVEHLTSLATTASQYKRLDNSGDKIKRANTLRKPLIGNSTT